MNQSMLFPLMDFEPNVSDSKQEIAQGLRDSPKQISCRFFYDTLGAKLFEAICELPEYYLTRTELSIFDAALPALAQKIGPHAAILEYGSGSGIKTERFLGALQAPFVYAPVDISRSQLRLFSSQLAAKFPILRVQPICADYNQAFEPLGLLAEARRKVCFFPGSTLGNFAPNDACEMLKRMRDLVGEDGAVVLGLDLAKDSNTIQAAYNDPPGVTAAFNLNALANLNRSVGTDFNLSQFRHDAVYLPEHHRVEMRLVSQTVQTVTLDDEEFIIDQGEHLLTEYSHKYPLKMIDEMLQSAGLERTSTWQDSQEWFAVLLAEPISS